MLKNLEDFANEKIFPDASYISNFVIYSTKSCKRH